MRDTLLACLPWAIEKSIDIAFVLAVLLAQSLDIHGASPNHPLSEGEGRGGMLLIPGSQVGKMNVILSVCHQHDIVSNHVGMNLVIRGWYVAVHKLVTLLNRPH